MKKILFFIMLFPAYLSGEMIIQSPGETVLGGDYVGTDTAIRIVADDIILDLNGYFVTADLEGIIVEQNLENIVIKNGTIKDLSGTGINIGQNCSKITVENISIQDCQTAAIEAIGSAGNLLEKCRFISMRIFNCCTGVNAQRCIDIAFSNDLKLEDVSIIDTGTVANALDMIHIEDSERCNLESVRVSNNVASNLVGIACEDNTDSCIFRGCTILDNVATATFSGFLFNTATSREHVLFDCKVTNNQIDAGPNSQLYGFNFVLAEQISIEACIASGNVNFGNSGTSDCYGFYFDQGTMFYVLNCQSFLNTAPNDGTTNDAAGFFIGTTAGGTTGVKNSVFMHNIAFANNAFNDSRSYGFQVESALNGNENNFYINNRAIANGPNTPLTNNQIIDDSGADSSPGGVPAGSIVDLNNTSLNSSVNTTFPNVRII